MTRSKIAYVWCEDCDYSKEYELPRSTEEIGNNLRSDCEEHSKTDCRSMLIAAGRPKDD